MKKTIFIIFIVLMSSFAFAQAEEVNTLPDEQLKYFFKVRLIEAVQLMFAGGSADTEKRIEFMNRRAIEYQELAKQNKVDYLEDIERRRQLLQNRVEANVDDIENEHIKEMVQERLHQHITVLEGVLEQVPEQAKSGITTALENSGKVLEKFKKGEGNAN